MKIALVQSKPSLGKKEENINIIRKCIENNDAELFVFPELFLTGYNCRDYLISLAEYKTGKSISEISKISEENNCHIVFGMPEKSNKFKGLIFNTAAFVHPNGKTDCYRKWYLANFGPFQEKQFFTKGNELNIFETELGKIGILICYDIFFPEICKTYALQGVEILICISASPSTTRIYFEKVMVSRAIENTSFFMYSNLVGTEENLTFWGGNTVINPKGEILKKGKYFEEEVVTCEIDLNEIKTSRQFRPVLRDNRLDVYERFIK